MNLTSVRKQSSHGFRPRALFLSVLLLALFLFSACGSSSNQPGSATTTAASSPTPSVSVSLQSQGDAQLATFQQWINLMQQYQGNITTYQQQYTSDQQALRNAANDTAYKTALNTLNAHVVAIQIPALKAESTYLLQKLSQDAASFGKQHTYYDSYNNKTYQLGYEYGPTGAVGPLWIGGELSAAQTLSDYQQTIEDLNMDLTNFQAMVKNFGDKTPYNQVHATDIQLMQHYQYMNSKVVVISLSEQAMRVYD